MTADHISLLMLEGNKIEATTNSYTPYFFGSCFALIISGILHDSILKRSAYILLCFINLTQVCLEIGMIISAKKELEDSYVS